MHAREQQVPLDVVLGNPRPKSYHVSEYAGISLDRLYAAHVKGSKGRLSVQNEITIQEYILNSFNPETEFGF